MGSSLEAKELLKRYSIARIPFITFNTTERTRALSVIKNVSEEIGVAMTFYVHTVSKGTYDLLNERVINEDKSFYGAVDFVSAQMQHKENITIILTEVPDISTDNTESRLLLDVVTLANDHGGSVIILTSNPVWNQLQRQGLIVKLDFPNEEEMYSIIKDYIDDYRSIINIEWDNADVRMAASLLVGASQIEAENVIAALIANRKIEKSDMDEVRRAKDRLFSDISGLEKVDVDDSVKEVGGLEGLRSWLNEKSVLLTPEKRDYMKERGLQPPRGILLVGVPGCGKSLSAKSIAANWKLPLYRLDFATVQGQYVGQSERQLREAFATAESVAPCVLWIDEIEKGLSGATSGGDGGVSTRMVGQFLFWMQECKKQVFVVATANDVSMLPSELLRRGRFDELFFVDLPSNNERRDILSIYFRKYLRLNFNGGLADRIVEMTDGFTAADLESTVRELAYRIAANDNFQLSESIIVSTFNNVVPLSQTSPEKIEAIRDWGKERAVPASGRPIGEQQVKKTGPKRRSVLVGGK